MLDEMGRVEAAEASIDAFVAKRARGALSGRDRANAEDEFWKARDRRQTKARRLENAKEWASHYGGLSYFFHDRAAICAQKRDEALALVRQLEAGDKGGAA